MNRVLLFVSALALVALCSAQAAGFQDLRTIDSFDEATPNIIIVVPSSPSFPLTDEKTTTGSFADGIFGNERNLLLTVNSGEADDVLSTGISNSDFSCTTPQDATGTTLLQYDGSDSTAVLDPSGLRSVNGLNTNLLLDDAFAFRSEMESDQPTSVIFRVYSGSSTDYCQYIQNLPGDDTLHEYFLNFIEFTDVGAGCDFSDVGAIEIIVDMFENVDVLITLVTTYGPIPTTVTPTRTKSPSLTPIPQSESATPSVTPPPSDTCNCRCPTFFCQVLRVDDGDYYFYNFDYDFFFFSAGFFDFFYYDFGGFYQFFYYFDFFYVPFYFFNGEYFTPFFNGNFFFDIWYQIL